MTLHTDTTQLPIFDQRYASCGTCELWPQCEKGQSATAWRPKNFNGLMLIGEGPGRQEVVEHRPFVGPSGRLLRDLCESIGIDFDECYVTNATLGRPPSSSEKFADEYPNAITSCLPRLEAEIQAVRPKVIVALGASAWLAISGYDVERVKNVEFKCERCDANRRVGPVIQCSANKPNVQDGGQSSSPCGHLHFLAPGASMEAQAQEVALIKARGCEACGAKLARVRPKMVKCPACGGRKRRAETFTTFEADYSLTAAAGAIFSPNVPTGAERAAHELHAWLGEAGVAYVVPTYHPAFILRGQSFLAKTMQKHLMKAKRLLDGGKPIEYKFETTADPKVLRDWVSWRVAPGKGNLTVDIETTGKLDPEDPTKRLDAREARNVGEITCIGFAVDKEALVVDTRGVDPKNSDDPLLAALYDILTDDSIGKTYHHGAGYDLLVLDLVWGFPVDHMVQSYTDDTLCAHANLYPDEPHTLAHVTFEAVDAYAWKPARKVKGAEVHGSFEELAAYNARDVIHTDLVRQHFGVKNGKSLPGARMDRAGLSRVYELDSILRKEAVRMTMRGLPLDHAAWAEVGRIAQANIEDAEARIQTVVAERDYGTFNPRSVPQKIALLFTSTSGFRLPVLSVTKPKDNTKQGMPSTDTDTIRKLLTSTSDPLALRFLNALRDLLAHDYVAKNFVFSEAMQPWADGRIHPIWQPWVPKTGRWSSSPNAQNWASWLKAAVVCDQGRKIVGSDYDQLELRNMALAAGDKALMKKCMEADERRKLEPEHDPHSYVASLAFGTRYTKLNLKDVAHSKDPKCRCETCTRKALRTITKCLHPDTLVWLRQGPRTLAELAVGDVIRSPTGWTRVVAKERELSDSVHVVTMRGLVTCSKTHQWPLVDGRCVPAGELVAGDVIASPIEPPSLQDHPYPTVQLPGGAIRGLPTMNVPLSHDWAYIAGLWCGDGSISGHNGIISHGHISKTDQFGCKYTDWQQQIVDSLTTVGFVPRARVMGVSLGDRHSTRLLGALGLTTTPSKRILRVPSWVRAAGRTATLHFLGGLVDTNGYVSHRDGSMRVCTKDPVFAGQLAAALHSAGLDASIGPACTHPASVTYQRYYWIIHIPSSSSPKLEPYMKHTGKLARLRLVKPHSNKVKDRTHRVKLVLPAGEIPTIDIQVSASDHLFVANTMASHNSVIYALNYGAGDQKVLESIYEKGYTGPPVTIDMVALVRRTVFTAFPKIETWRNNAVQLARQSGELRSPLMGRRRIFPIVTEIPIPEIYNYPIQSMGADILNTQMALLLERLPAVDPSAFVIAQVHDALYVECNEDRAEAVSKLLAETLTVEHTINGNTMRFSASGSIADNWKDAA